MAASGARRAATLLVTALAMIAIVAGVWWLRREQRPAAGAGTSARAPAPPPPPRSAARLDAQSGGAAAGVDGDTEDAPALGEPAPARPTDPPIATSAARPASSATKETDPALAPVPAVRPLAELRDEASRRVREATRGCVRDDESLAASDQTVVFRYVLVLEPALARIEAARIVESSLVDDGLRDCILGVVGDLSWKLSEAPSARLEIQDSIRLSDLRTPG